MGDKLSLATPWWYWVIGILLIVLGIQGVTQWLPYYTGGLADLEQQDPELWRLWTSAPIWAEAGYGAGILGMFLGSVGFVLRRRRSVWFFAVGATGLLLHRFWLFGLSGLTSLLPSYAPVSLFLAVLFDLCAISILLVSARRGWVR